MVELQEINMKNDISLSTFKRGVNTHVLPRGGGPPNQISHVPEPHILETTGLV